MNVIKKLLVNFSKNKFFWLFYFYLFFVIMKYGKKSSIMSTVFLSENLTSSSDLHAMSNELILETQKVCVYSV